MTVSIGSGFIELSRTWPELAQLAHDKVLSLQYDESTTAYHIIGVDDEIVYTTIIYKGTVPAGSGVSQANNDLWKAQFEVAKSELNKPLPGFEPFDVRYLRRFGNKTATSTSEALMSSRAYVVQGSQAQRSIKSTSANDAVGGSGASKVRITFLNSNYVRKEEDITLQGTTRLSTVSTDIRFIENLQVVAGSAAAGAIQLLDATGGAQNEFAGIASATTDAFMCHHYVPSGSRGFIVGWGAVTDDDASFKLLCQHWYSGSLVDEVCDVTNLAGIGLPPGRLEFYRKFEQPIPIEEKTYIRVTAVPSQATSTIMRAYLDIWEDVLLVSGSQ